jgi:hypothetical protein
VAHATLLTGAIPGRLQTAVFQQAAATHLYGVGRTPGQHARDLSIVPVLMMVNDDLVLGARPSLM